jgi:hypothetical protein
VWLFRLAFAADDGQLIWESLVPLAGDMPGVRGRPDAIRRALNPDSPALHDLLRRTRAAQLEALQASLEAPLRRWHVRERALMEAVRAQHARLSAGVMQRGLFDARADRLAGAQKALLDRTLAQAEERLVHLSGSGRPRLDDCDLVFAVVLD